MSGALCLVVVSTYSSSRESPGPVHSHETLVGETGASCNTGKCNRRATDTTCRGDRG